jgi:hypothetical protein
MPTTAAHVDAEEDLIDLRREPFPSFTEEPITVSEPFLVAYFDSSLRLVPQLLDSMLLVQPKRRFISSGV